jgi:capsid protein
MEERRNYDAGWGGRLNANWRTTNQSAELTDRYSRDVVRARARDLERNSDMMNSIISPFVRNVVGKGFTLQVNTGK